MPDDFNFPAYASGNPVISQLFANEFALRQGNQAALQAQAARDTARAQIAAQSRLAESQLRGQQQADLFRMQQSADNNRLASRQLDIDEEYKKGILSRQPVGTQVDAERRKAAIIDANSNAVNDAARANALYQIALDAEITRAKKDDVASFGAGLFGGTTVAQIDDPNHPVRKAINKKVFDNVYRQLVAEKGGTIQSIIPDPQTFTFKPIQFDETGKAIALPLPTPTPNSTPTGAAMDISTPGFDYDDRGVAAGLGGAPTVVASVTPTPAMKSAAAFMTPSGAMPGGFATGTLTDQEKAQAIFRVGEPLVRGVLSSAADMFAPKAPAPTVVRIPVQGLGLMEVSQEDAAEAERQLRSVPPEQAAATAFAIREALLKSGRARIVTTTP